MQKLSSYISCLLTILRYGYLSFSRRVQSTQHSTNPPNRSWRYRAITISVSIRGPPSREEELREALETAATDLDGLVLENDDGLGDRRLTSRSP